MCGSERQWLRARIEIRLVRRSQPCCRQVRCVSLWTWQQVPWALSSPSHSSRVTQAGRPFSEGTRFQPGMFGLCHNCLLSRGMRRGPFFLLAFSRLGLHSPGLRWPPIQRATCHAFWGLGLKVCTITLGREPKPSYINSCVGQCREGVGGEEWNEAQEHFCLKHKL